MCTSLSILVSNLILLFFWSDYQVSLRFTFQTVLALIFLMLISVFASRSKSLSSSQYLHIPYPIHLLSGFWCSTSAYFYEHHFPSGEVSGIQFKLIGSHLAFSCCLQKMRELCFLSRQYCPSFDTIANFLWFHLLPHKLCLSHSTLTWRLCVSMLALLFYFVLVF